MTIGRASTYVDPESRWSITRYDDGRVQVVFPSADRTNDHVLELRPMGAVELATDLLEAALDR